MRSKQDDAGVEFGSVAQEWGKKAGLKEVKVSQELSKLKREFWAMQGESFLAWGRRIADEIGATFKVQGGKAVFVEEAEGKNVSGEDMPTVQATWGDNLLKWDVSPLLSRPRAESTVTRYYDPKAARWREVEVATESPRGKTKMIDGKTASGSTEAGQRARSLKRKSGKETGSGSVDIVGTLHAKAGGRIQLVGTRDGVDGVYIMETVRQAISRKGWTTTCSLRKPQDGAGADSRNSKVKAAAKAGTTTKNNSAVNTTDPPGSAVG